MSRRKKHHHKLNSRKQREKTWFITLRDEAQARPLHTCRKETWEERMAREKAERAQQRAEEMWAGKLYDEPIGPKELTPRWERLEAEKSQGMPARRLNVFHWMTALMIVGMAEPRR